MLETIATTLGTILAIFGILAAFTGWRWLDARADQAEHRARKLEAEADQAEHDAELN